MAAPTEVYVDPAGNANSGTGTIGDPYLDLQYALNTATRDATNGNRFNIKAGVDEILTAALSLSTYGTPTLAAPIYFQGYTATAGDGGIGGISGAGTYSIYLDNANYINFIDMHLHNTGSAQLMRINTGLVERCIFNNVSAICLQTSGRVINCYFYDIFGIGLFGSFFTAQFCYFTNSASKKFSSTIETGGNSKIDNCILNIDGVSTGIVVRSGGSVNNIFNNSIYSESGTGSGIRVDGGTFNLILNNVIAGFSGTGGTGIEAIFTGDIWMYGYNKFYNNATHENITTDIHLNLGNNTALSASPFTNPAGGDFSLSAEAKATSYPSSFYGSSTNNYLDPGAAQRQEIGGRRNRARFHGV